MQDLGNYSAERLKRKHDTYAVLDDAPATGEDFTFTPAIANKSRLICQKLDHKPIFHRYQDEIKARQSSLEKKKKIFEQERKDKLEKEDLSKIPPKLRHLKKITTSGKKFGSHSLDRMDPQDGISVTKLDLYSRNILWHEKKNQRLLEQQNEKRMTELNRSLDMSKLVGGHIKPSVACPDSENREQPVSGSSN